MIWFSLQRARFSRSATMRLFSNSETPAKQVRRHEDLVCAVISQVVRSMFHPLRFDFRTSVNRFIGLIDLFLHHTSNPHIFLRTFRGRGRPLIAALTRDFGDFDRSFSFNAASAHTAPQSIQYMAHKHCGSYTMNIMTFVPKNLHCMFICI